MKKKRFLTTRGSPFTPSERAAIKTNVKDVLGILPDKRKEAVERLFFYKEKGTILAAENGTSRQNIHKLAHKGLEYLKKNKDIIWVVDKNPHNEGSLAASAHLKLGSVL